MTPADPDDTQTLVAMTKLALRCTDRLIQQLVVLHRLADVIRVTGASTTGILVAAAANGAAHEAAEITWELEQLLARLR